MWGAFAASSRRMAAANAARWMLFRMKSDEPLRALAKFPHVGMEHHVAGSHDAVVAIPISHIKTTQVQGRNGQLKNVVAGWREWTHIPSPDGVRSEGSFRTEDGLVQWRDDTSNLDNPDFSDFSDLSDFSDFSANDIVLTHRYTPGHTLRCTLERRTVK